MLLEKPADFSLDSEFHESAQTNTEVTSPASRYVPGSWRHIRADSLNLRLRAVIVSSHYWDGSTGQCLAGQ